MNKVLIVGQTPPPYGGQAVMIEYLVKAKFTRVEKCHVRMDFSRDMEEIGHVTLRKLLHLFSIVYKIIICKIKERPNILYFPPSGPTKSVYRDIFILAITRPLFKKTIFHFHASGLHENYISMGRISRRLFAKAFDKPDVCIHLSSSCPQEGNYIGSRKNIIIPNGIPDICMDRNMKKHDHVFTVLFIGLLNGTKGEIDLIKAGGYLKRANARFKINIAGQFNSTENKDRFFKLINDNDLGDYIEYIGLIRNEQKHNYFSDADAFCFPSFFNSESFPLVLLEAMSYSLPIITTNWRGIPDMVKDGYNGFLVGIHNPNAIAEKLLLLYENTNLRKEMAKNSRMEFESKYILSKHLDKMEDCLCNIEV